MTEITPEETENPLGGYGRTISHVIIGLKTSKGSKQLRLDPSIYDALQKEKVSVGDVIYIEANSGAVKRVGRSDVYASEFDLEADEYVPVPKGDVHKKKGKRTHHWNLHTEMNIKFLYFFHQRSCRMLHCTTWTCQMLVPRAAKTSCPWWDSWLNRRRQR